MAAGLSQLRRAVVDRLNLLDATAYRHVPDAVEVPALFVEPASPFVDYAAGYGRPEWKFLVTVVVNRIDPEAAQDTLDDFLDPDGPIVEVLQRTDVNDDLGQLAQIEVLNASRYGSYRIGNTSYLGAQMTIRVQI